MNNFTPYYASMSSAIMQKKRTAGDGMESDEIVSEIQNKPRKTSNTDSLLPGRLIQIYPSKVIKSEVRNTPVHSKSPKFVPYEPYRAAVKPMTSSALKGAKKSKNNMDINTLISQMSQMKTDLNEYKPRPKLTSITSDKSYDGDKIEKTIVESEEIQKQMDDLRKENESLREQLKQQAQVNKELKTMLVASMGEDLETQVQSLNEDKKHLANALLSSAQHLSTHQEQTEWLAGQCEVWRSKFLASSLMVEELANCKKLLNEKTENLRQSIRQLLDEKCRTRDMLLCCYKNLYSLHEKWLENIAISGYVGNTKVYNQPIGNLNFSAITPHSTNVLDLASVNLKLSENISTSIEKHDITHLDGLPRMTDAENLAEIAMSMPVDTRRASEAPVTALVHHAYNASGSAPRQVASCVHCNGKVQLL